MKKSCEGDVETTWSVVNYHFCRTTELLFSGVNISLTAVDMVHAELE
jgi:hypothetical protein